MLEIDLLQNQKYLPHLPQVCKKNHFHARVKANRKHSVDDIMLQALFHCAYTCMCSRRKVHFFTFPFPYTIIKESALSRLFCLLESALSHHSQNKQPPLVDSFLLAIIPQNLITIINYLMIPLLTLLPCIHLHVIKKFKMHFITIHSTYNL